MMLFRHFLVLRWVTKSHFSRYTDGRNCKGYFEHPRTIFFWRTLPVYDRSLLESYLVKFVRWLSSCSSVVLWYWCRGTFARRVGTLLTNLVHLSIAVITKIPTTPIAMCWSRNIPSSVRQIWTKNQFCIIQKIRIPRRKTIFMCYALSSSTDWISVLFRELHLFAS